MKYIDADKLKAEIEGQIEEEKNNIIEETALYYGARQQVRSKILHIIDSLQQEQESIAERFAKIVRGNLIGIDKEVQQKFEGLYFEVTGNKMYGGYND